MWYVSCSALEIEDIHFEQRPAQQELSVQDSLASGTLSVQLEALIAIPGELLLVEGAQN